MRKKSAIPRTVADVASQLRAARELGLSDEETAQAVFQPMLAELERLGRSLEREGKLGRALALTNAQRTALGVVREADDLFLRGRGSDAWKLLGKLSELTLRSLERQGYIARRWPEPSLTHAGRVVLAQIERGDL